MSWPVYSESDFQGGSPSDRFGWEQSERCVGRQNWNGGGEGGREGGGMVALARKHLLEREREAQSRSLKCCVGRSIIFQGRRGQRDCSRAISASVQGQRKPSRPCEWYGRFRSQPKDPPWTGLLKRSPFCHHLKHGFFHQNQVGNHHLQGNVQVYNVRIPDR